LAIITQHLSSSNPNYTTRHLSHKNVFQRKWKFFDK
jgi:hypothetical protein